uniref:Uncharacterized protein n=1 Tax=Equus asinus TaxID=9793 RepID=A0A9L0K4J2_EQUAS
MVREDILLFQMLLMNAGSVLNFQLKKDSKGGNISAGTNKGTCVQSFLHPDGPC